MLRTNAIAPEKRQRAIEVIERNAVSQNLLVEDLLDMSRITTGKVRLDAEPVPVVTLLREAVDGITPAADAKGIAMRAKWSPRMCPAVAVSAYARLDDRSRAIAAGFQAHVAKPVDPAALVRALCRVATNDGPVARFEE